MDQSILPNKRGYANVGDDRALVSQSMPLLRLTHAANLSLGALKLLNMYLAGIDPTNDTTAPVMITVRDYADAIGVAYGNISLELLDRQLEMLLSLQFAQKADDTEGRPLGNGRLARIPAFSYATVRPEKIGGMTVQTISICCNPLAAHLFFDLVESRYLKYRLKYVARLDKIATYRLYLFLLEYRNTRLFMEPVSLDRLRKALGYDTTYRDTKAFLRKLDAAVKELNEKTDLSCDINRVSAKNDARRVAAIRFRVIEKHKQGVVGKPENALEYLPEPTEHPDEQVTTGIDAAGVASENEIAERTRSIAEAENMFHNAFRRCQYTLTYEEEEAVIQAAKAESHLSGNDLYDYLSTIAVQTNMKKGLKYPYKYMCGIIANYRK